MALDGNWNIEINSPMGLQKGTLELKTDGGALSGSQSAMGSSSPIAGGKAEGDRGTWASSITSPMPMTLEFEVTASGDALTGSVKAGAFGSFPLKGTRA